MDLVTLKEATKDLKPREREFIFEYMSNGKNGTQAYKKVFNSSSVSVAGVGVCKMLKRPKIANALNKLADTQIEIAAKAIEVSKETQTLKAEKIYLMTHDDPDTANTALKAIDQQNKLHGLYIDQGASGGNEWHNCVLTLVQHINKPLEATSSESEGIIEVEAEVVDSD
jgi:hypothetical protein